MTTTPGAARGILVVGARKHSTLQATAPRRTTTLSTAVRIHPAPCASPSFVSSYFSFCKFMSTASKCISVQPHPTQCNHIRCHGGFLWAWAYAVIGVWGEGSEVVDAGQGGSWPLRAWRFIEVERCGEGRTAAAEPLVDLVDHLWLALKSYIADEVGSLLKRGWYLIYWFTFMASWKTRLLFLLKT